MMFPAVRPRRLRYNPVLREMVRETTLSVANFICPLFVTFGNNIKRPIQSMPGCFVESVDVAVTSAAEIYSSGIAAVILFGIPEHKDEKGSGAYDPDGVIQRAVSEIKNAVPALFVITDICLCEYTSHGHCGIVENGQILNDQTLELLARTAVSHARAGADMAAPSDMMDGRVRVIRAALDSEGFSPMPIMSYAVKYSSAFYGPFREAAQSTPTSGDRKSHQMDPANRREALKEASIDIDEGADILMVKPALSYLDIISDVKHAFNVPVAAYNVSGEYSMVHAGARLGWIDYEKVMMEILISIKRAGADLILTYFAKDAAKVLNETC
ncbi:porphobilinogen synthase [Candidatus Magnetobacterium casensis]|uniref:Delta-aminolevulinic acid dehydratase n=1 Tax=Candidatus Magnetobacterium casense TaxID=1455061 RepID=A0ABS6RYQ0_9BACT|nr:porphobilinogen synthase [Candidatus Magnetobacterium casensis]